MTNNKATRSEVFIRIYFAGPLFTTAELDFNKRAVARLRELGCEVFLPQENEQGTNPRAIFKGDVGGIDWSNVVVANMDGSDPDSGTSWECGYAYAKFKPAILYRTDIRQEAGPLGPYNLMMHQGASNLVDARGMAPEDLADDLHRIAHSLLYGVPPT